jgi:hypothetical protein
MRGYQLASKTGLVVRDRSECEEAILEVTRQEGTVLQVLERLSLGVQQPLYALGDFIAVGQEQLEKFDMLPKRHLDRIAYHHASPLHKKWREPSFSP